MRWTARSGVRRAAASVGLVVVALAGLCGVQAGRDLPTFDGSPRLAAEGRTGDAVATLPIGSGHVEHDQGGAAKPGHGAPTSLGPATVVAAAITIGTGAAPSPAAAPRPQVAPGGPGPRAPPTA